MAKTDANNTFDVGPCLCCGYLDMYSYWTWICRYCYYQANSTLMNGTGNSNTELRGQLRVVRYFMGQGD